MTNIKRFIVIRDGNLYDSSDDRATAIQRAKSWQHELNGIWQVFDRKHDNQEEYSIGPTTIEAAT